MDKEEVEKKIYPLTFIVECNKGKTINSFNNLQLKAPKQYAEQGALKYSQDNNYHKEYLCYWKIYTLDQLYSN